MIKAVIFDMDGLMIDSERITFEGYQKIFKEQNLEFTMDFYKTLLGNGMTIVKKLFKDEYGDNFDFEALIQVVHQHLKDTLDQGRMPLKPGIISLLEYLKSKDIKTIVATSSQRTRVDAILSKLNLVEYFNDSICGDEVVNGKPNPEIFLKACQKLDVLPSQALVLEDSQTGIQAAFDAKIPVICIPDLKYPDDEYASICLDILDNLEFVKKYI